MKSYLSTITVAMLCLIVTLPGRVTADRLTVVASVFPLFDFAREIAGPAADVRLLLPPGVDPHSWEPRPSDIVLLSSADIFLYTSDQMEPWAADFARTIRKRDTISIKVMDSLGFSHSDENNGTAYVIDGGNDHGEDPHFWLNLSLAARAASILGKTIANSDPDNRDLFLSNAESYASRLNDLDNEYTARLRNCRSRKLVTGGHAAFGHLAERYDLEQVSVYGLSPDAEPSPKHLAGIVKIVKEEDIRTVFSEELMNPRMTEVLSKETGTRIMVLNPAGNLSAEQWQRGVTFVDIMEENLSVLREGLGCE